MSDFCTLLQLEVGSTIPDFETHTSTYTVQIQCKQTTGVDGTSASIDVSFTDVAECEYSSAYSVE